MNPMPLPPSKHAPPPTVVLAEHAIPHPIHHVHGLTPALFDLLRCVSISIASSLQNQEKLMASFEEISAKVDKILAEVKAHKDQDAAVVAALTAERDALKAELEKGGLTADQEAIITGRLDEIDAVFEDLPAPPEPAPTA